MAHRTTKSGLDYFSFDVDFFEDPKIQFVGAKYGTLGEYIIIRLLCRIYRNGYYLPWGDDECLLFTRKDVPEATARDVQSVVLEASRRGFFSEKHLLKYSILTSNGIQSRFLEATRRRKRVSIYREYLIADIEGLNVDIKPLNVDILQQSKVKESKVKKNPPKPPLTKTQFAYPDWLDKKLWADFKEHRKALKPKMTARAEELALKKLKKLIDAGDDQQEIIEQSIENGWKSLYPVKDRQRRRYDPNTDWAENDPANRILN